ncbi:MAG: hypothetical protein K2G94_05815, partial [Muribaculaceae bacterium]|nr:hypothetical protein [Muribaculaceae bacterium]
DWYKRQVYNFIFLNYEAVTSHRNIFLRCRPSRRREDVARIVLFHFQFQPQSATRQPEVCLDAF